MAANGLSLYECGPFSCFLLKFIFRKIGNNDTHIYGHMDDTRMYIIYNNTHTHTYIIYLKGSDGGEKETFHCWFIHQMPETARSGPG